MGTSYRIKVVQNNKSFYTTPDLKSGMGATVIPAVRGPSKPTKFNTGETQRIVQLFGAGRFETLEAIAYNNKYPLWISAPASCGVTSALLITNKGLKPIGLSLDDKDRVLNLSNLMLQYPAGKGDGENAVFEVTIPRDRLPNIDGYTPMIFITIGDEVLSLGTGDYNTDEHTISLPLTKEIDIAGTTKQITGNGTLKLHDDNEQLTLSFTFDDSCVDITKGKQVMFRITSDANQISDLDVYGVVGMRFPCKDFLSVLLSKSDKGNLNLDLIDTKSGRSVTGYPIETSLIKGKEDATGKLIYCNELFKDDDYIFVESNDNFDFENNKIVISDIPELANFKFGNRGVACDGQTLAKGWEKFKDFKKYPADVYFDVTGETEIPSTFSSLRTAIPYKRFLYPHAVNSTPTDAAQTKPAVDNRGICAFWGSAYILNPYEKTGNLLSTLMGEIASRYADAIVYSYGGRAVAWGDENQVGGQLSQGRIVEFLYNATEDEMKALDKLGINPVVLNELFGPMVASRRTTDSSGSDYSYADYSMITDYCIERIVNEVLPYQLIKFNDDIHRAIVREKAQNILKPLLIAPNNVIRDYAIKCDSDNNGDDILEQQLFVLTIAIKVTPKSEYIQFNFINSAQGGSVEEDAK